MPQRWAFSTIFLPQRSAFRTFFVPGGWGIRPFKKITPGFARGEGGWSGFELTDTSIVDVNETILVRHPEKQN